MEPRKVIKKFKNAINNLWQYTGELFEMDKIDLAFMKQVLELIIKN